jgi:hypothetical protein
MPLNITHHRRVQRRRTSLPWPTAALLAAGAVQTAAAVEIDTGIPELTLRLDTTVRGNLGVRLERQDPRILANPAYDESDGKFGRGDAVTQRLDLLGELDLQYRKSAGLRLSAAAWYDHAYRDGSLRARSPGLATSYSGDHYSHSVDRYVHGPSGEVLDAFAWLNFRIADTPANLKIGRHTNYWGEALITSAHGISYAQSPVDGVKAVTSPGTELKEVFLPLGQVYAKWQPTPELALAAQAFTEWKPSRLPYGGTYFGAADFFFEGPDRLPLGPGLNASRQPSVKPGNTGNWGLSARLNIEPIEATAGLYYRRFNDYQPWFSPSFGGFTQLAPGVVVPTTFQLVYPKNVSIVGLSLARGVGPVSVGAELSYRQHGALNAAGINPQDNEGPRGNTWHAVVNGVYLLPGTTLWDTGSLVVEAAYGRLASVTSNAALYKQLGSAACTSALNPPGGTLPGNKDDGCATRDHLALAVLFTPQWLQFAPSMDLSLPISLSAGLKGNAPSNGGGNEGTLAWSVGARLVVGQKHEITLQYADSQARAQHDAANTVQLGGSGPSSTNDRGWLALTYKVGF